MTVEQLRAAREANPFRPFIIHLANERSLTVPHRDYLSMSPGGRTVIVYQAGEAFNIIDLLWVTELAIGEGARPGEQQRARLIRRFITGQTAARKSTDWRLSDETAPNAEAERCQVLFPEWIPYLESHWRDVHASLVIYARDALQVVLPGGLRARAEESVLLETPQGPGDHPLFPDVRVVEFTGKRESALQPAAGVAMAEPLVVPTESESVTEPFLEIIDKESGNRVVTVIEFLSPSNKSPGPNREQYVRKQREICSSDANLVEIDLNRFGTHTLAFPLAHVKPQGRTAYMACVRRALRRGEAQVYPMPLWERLPILKIPLRSGDADVPLDLQALIEQCYRNGAYAGTIDYAAPPDPPLYGAEETWAAERLREMGLRSPKKTPRRKGKSKPR